VSTAFYNEIDEHAAATLRNLIAGGHIAPGVVDTRSIEDIEPRELTRYTQCHFFAGIGVWSYALRLAGWPDSRPVWTGSCPCQPFSSAGKGAGFSDERHLWPAWLHLISQCRPPAIHGEQVASKDAEPWLDLVQDDLEAVGYSFGAVPFPSAGVGAPHIRDRLYWVADIDSSARRQGCADVRGRLAGSDAESRSGPGGGGVLVGLGDTCSSACARFDGRTHVHGFEDSDSRAAGFVVDASSARLAQRIGVGRVPGSESGADARQAHIGAGVHVDPLADDDDEGLHRFAGLRLQRPDLHDADGRRVVGGFWADADWIPCRDNKWRPVEPGTFPLAHGAPARVGRLRAYGNAINAEAARARGSKPISKAK